MGLELVHFDCKDIIWKSCGDYAGVGLLDFMVR